MNGHERDAIGELQLEVKEIHKAVEAIKTNDLPHIHSKINLLSDVLNRVVGKQAVILPLVTGTLITIVIGMLAIFFLG